MKDFQISSPGWTLKLGRQNQDAKFISKKWASTGCPDTHSATTQQDALRENHKIQTCNAEINTTVLLNTLHNNNILIIIISK